MGAVYHVSLCISTPLHEILVGTLLARRFVYVFVYPCVRSFFQRNILEHPFLDKTKRCVDTFAGVPQHISGSYKPSRRPGLIIRTEILSGFRCDRVPYLVRTPAANSRSVTGPVNRSLIWIVYEVGYSSALRRKGVAFHDPPCGEKGSVGNADVILPMGCPHYGLTLVGQKCSTNPEENGVAKQYPIEPVQKRPGWRR